jgi:hypothetical protein
MAILLVSNFHPLYFFAQLALSGLFAVGAWLVYKYADVLGKWREGDILAFPSAYRIFMYRFAVAPVILLFALVVLLGAISSLSHPQCGTVLDLPPCPR